MQMISPRCCSASSIPPTDMELMHTDAWAHSCNLSLNSNKSSKIINHVTSFLIKDIAKVHTINILGVGFNEKFGFFSHFLCTKAISLSAVYLYITHESMINFLLLVITFALASNTARKNSGVGGLDFGGFH